MVVQNDRACEGIAPSTRCVPLPCEQCYVATADTRVAHSVIFGPDDAGPVSPLADFTAEIIGDLLA